MLIYDLNEAVLAFSSFLFSFCLVGLSKRSVELLELCAWNINTIKIIGLQKNVKMSSVWLIGITRLPAVLLM